MGANTFYYVVNVVAHDFAFIDSKPVNEWRKIRLDIITGTALGNPSWYMYVCTYVYIFFL